MPGRGSDRDEILSTTTAVSYPLAQLGNLFVFFFIVCRVLLPRRLASQEWLVCRFSPFFSTVRAPVSTAEVRSCRAGCGCQGSFFLRRDDDPDSLSAGPGVDHGSRLHHHTGAAVVRYCHCSRVSCYVVECQCAASRRAHAGQPARPDMLIPKQGSLSQLHARASLAEAGQATFDSEASPGEHSDQATGPYPRDGAARRLRLQRHPIQLFQHCQRTGRLRHRFCLCPGARSKCRFGARSDQ